MVHGRGQCLSCERETIYQKTSPDHLFHLIMTFATLGLWLPIWIFVAWRSRLWRCGVCGTVAGRGVEGLHKVEMIKVTPEDRDRVSPNPIWDTKKVFGLILLTIVFGAIVLLAVKG
ncbi:MAG: hypothetical protein ACLFTB_05955 [Desulfovibrionales bacterium]